MTRARRRRGKPTLVKDVVGRVVGDLGLDGLQAAFDVGEQWEEVVGAEIARHCRPVAVRHGVLEAEVDSSVWAQQLQLQRPAILAALASALGDRAPTDLRFHVGYTRRP